MRHCGLRADRRTGRLRGMGQGAHVLMPHSSDIAIVATAQTPTVRSVPQNEVQLLVPTVNVALGARRDLPTGCGVHLRRQLRLPHRRTVRLRPQPRGRRRVAADLGVTRRDGRRVGAVRSVGPPHARRHRCGAGLRVGQVLTVEPCRSCGRNSSTRTISPLSASIRCPSPESRHVSCSIRARRPSVTSPRSSPAAGGTPWTIPTPS